MKYNEHPPANLEAKDLLDTMTHEYLEHLLAWTILDALIEKMFQRTHTPELEMRIEHIMQEAMYVREEMDNIAFIFQNNPLKHFK